MNWTNPKQNSGIRLDKDVMDRYSRLLPLGFRLYFASAFNEAYVTAAEPCKVTCGSEWCKPAYKQNHYKIYAEYSLNSQGEKLLAALDDLSDLIESN